MRLIFVPVLLSVFAIAPGAQSIPPCSNPSGARVEVSKASVLPAAGQAGLVFYEVANRGPADLIVDAAGLRILDAGGEPAAGFQVSPLETPSVLRAGTTTRIEFRVASPAVVPATAAPSSSLFLYNTAVGSGRNLIANPSLEDGRYHPKNLPDHWTLVHEGPARADRVWSAHSTVGGAYGMRVEKTVDGGSSALWQLLGEGVLLPNSTYTFSGWVRSDALAGEAWAGLYLFWYDREYHPAAPRPRGMGTTGWTYASGTFDTADLPVLQALVQGVVVGAAGGASEFDNFALSLGSMDGAITLNGPIPPLAQPSDPVPGDLNGDGAVNVADATRALRIAVGIVIATPAELEAGDGNGNGRIDVADVTRILRRAVGLA